MPEGMQDFSKIMAEIRKEFLHFANSYASAVKSGAEAAGKQIIKTAEKSDDAANMDLGKLIEAVKTGVQCAGEQMIKSGTDFLEHIKEKAKKQ